MIRNFTLDYWTDIGLMTVGMWGSFVKFPEFLVRGDIWGVKS